MNAAFVYDYAFMKPINMSHNKLLQIRYILNFLFL